MSHSNPTSASFPRAPCSIWHGGKYISPSDVGYEALRDIFSRSNELTSTQVKRILAAYTIGKLAHGYKGVQTRRSGERYIDHPKAVALIDFLECGQRNADVLCAEMLHDTIEDTELGENPIEMMRRGGSVLRIVRMVTNPEKVADSQQQHARKVAHYQIIGGDIEASQGKVADRTQNLRTLEICVKKEADVTEKDCIRASDQFKETVQFILPIAQNITGKGRPYRQVLEKELIAVQTLLKHHHYS